ncbi:MAG: exodeoxyribonuclease VII large subunit, partial [Synergistaceae bacterium]|nr:exodeoxyribonuclease VII large subunit [Synergistaceae bacterium]
MNEVTQTYPKILTVDELSGTIKAVISSSPLLRGVAVKGEIQNFKRHSSGHVYFTLSGNESKISAVLFRSHASGV